MLWIELRSENTDLLLEAPPSAESADAAFTPAIRHANVSWMPSRGHVRCFWYDAKRAKHRTKSMAVEFDEGMSDSQKQDIVNIAAEGLQEFYSNHHTEAPRGASDPPYDKTDHDDD